MELKPELVIADRFRLVRLLGEGGMGSVWLAHHIRLQIPCAVKFMRPEVAAQPTYRDRFDREAIAAAKLRSPHVVQILDHGVWEGAPYIAMECLEGEDLAARLARQKTLSPEETVAILAQVARALTKAHAAGLVHRDLKPPNIFIVREDDHEIVKVLDFGIAKTSAPDTGQQTKTGTVMGTPYYMSPEQAQGTKSVDHRTDLWALGVIAFRCLTGALPFVSDAFGDLVLKIIVEPLPVPSKIAPVPPGFDAWWARAVARDPAARFQSAKELVDALAEALAVRVAAGALTVVERHDTPVNTGEEPPARPARSAGTLAAAVAPVAAPPRDRSRVYIAIAVAISAAGVAGAFVLGKGTPSKQPVSATGPTASPSAIATMATTAAPTVSAAPSATATAQPSAEPSASAAAIATAAHDGGDPHPHPSASAAHRPLGTAKPGRPAPTAQPQGHDIGF